jgi:hypothetical protein
MGSWSSVALPRLSRGVPDALPFAVRQIGHPRSIFFITARFQEPRNTLEFAKTLSMKDAGRESEIHPH